jgi:hypothetical protein
MSIIALAICPARRLSGSRVPTVPIVEAGHGEHAAGRACKELYCGLRYLGTCIWGDFRFWDEGCFCVRWASSRFRGYNNISGMIRMGLSLDCKMVDEIGTEQREVRMAQDIVKIVYFDEGSATDFIQIYNGGSLVHKVVNSGSDSSEGNAEVEANVGIGSKILDAFGLAAKAKVGGSLNASFSDSTVVKSILANTVLTDFLEAVEKQGENCAVKSFEGRRVAQIPGSISSISLLTPYLSMLRSGQVIPAGDLNISIDKLDSTLSKAKGYFEFLGVEDKEDGDEEVIFRFNGNAFKNNYRPTNLQKMCLKLFAVYVGDCSLADLTVDSELSIEGFGAKDNPDYVSVEGKADVSGLQLLKMYDVILAGVVADA